MPVLNWGFIFLVIILMGVGTYLDDYHAHVSTYGRVYVECLLTNIEIVVECFEQVNDLIEKREASK